MKKYCAILLVIALLVSAVFLTYALAEAPAAPEQSAPLVDLTGALVAVLLLVFEFLLAWIARVIVPPIKAWLRTHTTEKERGLLWDAICKLVDAAEQIITGPAMGERRMAYVQAGLRQRGLTIDVDMIEAAVRRMKQNTRITFADAFDIGKGLDGDEIEPIPVDKNGEPDLNIDHWSLDQIKGFFKINGFDDTGLTTRDEYMDFLVSQAEPPRDADVPAPARAVKDYCELDEDGNPIPEEPQSGNE